MASDAKSGMWDMEHDHLMTTLLPSDYAFRLATTPHSFGAASPPLALVMTLHLIYEASANFAFNGRERREMSGSNCKSGVAHCIDIESRVGEARGQAPLLRWVLVAWRRRRTRRRQGEARRLPNRKGYTRRGAALESILAEWVLHRNSSNRAQR